MALPIPLSDDPKKWDGWRFYNSENYYERLGFTFEEQPTDEQIEDSCRQLLVWWQKKLPLKNQPSNPVAQMLRAGLDDAPRLLSQARAELLNPEARARLDAVLESKLKERAQAEFHKFLAFSITDGFLHQEAESRLVRLGTEHGLSLEEILKLINHQLNMAGAQRRAEGSGSPQGGGAMRPDDPVKEFIRLLDLAGLDDGEMTDDQRDTFVNMAENLGLAPGDAEDLIDDWIEAEQSGKPLSGAALSARPPDPTRTPPPKKPTTPPPPPVSTRIEIPVPKISPDAERAEFAPFRNMADMEMMLVPSGNFLMGCAEPGAPPNESPVRRVHLFRYYISKFPVTNEAFEKFDPTHRAKRPGWAGPDHPVVYVNSLEAIKFCEWLSVREGRRYRLPTEAEWEFAARGADGRIYPWGNFGDAGYFANFADRNTKFAWSDRRIDDGFAETAPVGSYPRGASPCGVEDLSGNVWEWCLDFYDTYKSKEQTNPRGPINGSKRVYRGGSWRSRFANLRSTARSFNSPTYSFNDVGFRVVCEIKPV